MDIGGRTALVTGAGSGIGRAVAERLARLGARVLVADVDEDAGRETVARIGDAASFRYADVTRAADVEQMIAAAGGLDVLVNNAGGYDLPTFPDAPVEHWSHTLDLNLHAVMLCIHYAVRAMEPRGRGVIVNLGSSAGHGLGPHPGPEYAAAKAGVARLTAALAPLAERGIRVNCVSPYTVATADVRRWREELRAAGDELPEPLRGVLLEPDEVADGVLRFVEDDSLAGRVLVLVGSEEPRLLPAE